MECDRCIIFVIFCRYRIGVARSSSRSAIKGNKWNCVYAIIFHNISSSLYNQAKYKQQYGLGYDYLCYCLSIISYSRRHVVWHGGAHCHECCLEFVRMAVSRDYSYHEWSAVWSLSNLDLLHVHYQGLHVRNIWKFAFLSSVCNGVLAYYIISGVQVEDHWTGNTVKPGIYVWLITF